MRRTIIALLATVSLALAMPDEKYATGTIPTNGGGTATAVSPYFSGTLRAVEMMFATTGNPATSTVVMASSGAGGLPGQTVFSITGNTTTNLWRYPVAQATTSAVAVAWYVPYVFRSEQAVFTLTGGNSNTVAFTARVLYDTGN